MSGDIVTRQGFLVAGDDKDPLKEAGGSRNPQEVLMVAGVSKNPLVGLAVGPPGFEPGTFAV